MTASGKRPGARHGSVGGDSRSGRVRNGAARGRSLVSGGRAGSSTKDAAARPRFRNDYKGFHPPPRWTPARVAVGDILPEDFYRRYVATRTPCVLTTAAGGATSASRLLGKAPPRWSLDELKERAGHVAVKVEIKDSHGSFGKRTPRQRMLFADFLDAIDTQGRTDLYLTTQYQDEVQPAAEWEEGDGNNEAELRWKAHAYCQAPLTALLDDIELRPPLFGKLVPQQVNLWLGAVPTCDSNGTSSGLHHDFHDNLYVLLRGRKRFTLFSPHDSGRMYLHGELSHLHENGLINYRGAETRSDGANPLDVARWRSKKALQRLAAAEAAGEDEAVAEDELEQAMDALLDVDCLDEEWPGEVDDKGRIPGSADKRKRRLSAGGSAPAKRKAVAEFVEAGSSEPPSFSKIPASALHSSKQLGLFPLLSGARGVTCELSEGDILYLPASWFHEVTSYGLRVTDDESHPNDRIHMAINYWMVPPATDDPTKPYEDDYWESEWGEVERAILDGILCESRCGALPRPNPAQETPVWEERSSARATRDRDISRPVSGLEGGFSSSSGGAVLRRRVRKKRETRPKPRWIVKDA